MTYCISNRATAARSGLPSQVGLLSGSFHSRFHSLCSDMFGYAVMLKNDSLATGNLFKKNGC